MIWFGWFAGGRNDFLFCNIVNSIYFLYFFEINERIFI